MLDLESRRPPRTPATLPVVIPAYVSRAAELQVRRHDLGAGDGCGLFVILTYLFVSRLLAPLHWEKQRTLRQDQF